MMPNLIAPDRDARSVSNTPTDVRAIVEDNPQGYAAEMVKDVLESLRYAFGGPAAKGLDVGSVARREALGDEAANPCW